MIISPTVRLVFFYCIFSLSCVQTFTEKDQERTINIRQWSLSQNPESKTTFTRCSLSHSLLGTSIPSSHLDFFNEASLVSYLTYPKFRIFSSKFLNLITSFSIVGNCIFTHILTSFIIKIQKLMQKTKFSSQKSGVGFMCPTLYLYRLFLS